MKYVKKDLDRVTKPRYSEHVLPVPWPFNISRFHCNWRDLTVLFITFLNCLRTIFLNMLHQLFSVYGGVFRRAPNSKELPFSARYLLQGENIP